MIQHNNALSKFVSIVDSKRMVNPEERVALFEKLKTKQALIYNTRLKYLANICENSAKDLTKHFLDEKIEKLNKKNDEVQLEFDEIIKSVTNLEKKVMDELEELLQTTEDRLFFISAYEKPVLQEIIENDCKVLISKRKTE